jgi:chromate reductase, NAD(P)H dehydrogenase (quinone)
MTSPFRVLLICGSLRRNSTNGAVLRTAHAVAPAGVATTYYEGLASIPAFNPDDDVPPLPSAVAELRSAIRSADALIFCVPEYAGALPGWFKNILDWMVGDDQAGSIHEKPVAWINASARGAVLAHESLRTVLRYVNADIVEAACAHVPVSNTDVSSDGLISCEARRRQIAEALVQLAVHVKRKRSDAAGSRRDRRPTIS